jgi:hypothetical protein
MPERIQKEFLNNEYPLFDSAEEERQKRIQEEREADEQERKEQAISDSKQRSRNPHAPVNKAEYYRDREKKTSADRPYRNFFDPTGRGDD